MDVNQLILYDVLKWTFGPWFSLWLRLKSEGVGNVPREGGGVLVGNHRQPVLDPMVVSYKLDRPVNWIGYQATFNIPVFKTLAKTFGVIPVDIMGGEKSHRALDAAVEVLKDGELVGLFPEGARAVTQLHKATRVMNFHTGFARIALRARVPVIPLAVIVGEEKHLPNIPPFITKMFWDHPDLIRTGHPVTLYKRVLLRVGRPIDLGEFYDQEITAALIHHISGKVRRVVEKLYDGEDLDRFMTGEKPFDIVTDRV